MGFEAKAEDVKRAALMLGHVLEFTPHYSSGGIERVTNRLWGKSRFVLICDRCKKSVILEYTKRTPTEAMLPSVFSLECSGPPQWSLGGYVINRMLMEEIVAELGLTQTQTRRFIERGVIR